MGFKGQKGRKQSDGVGLFDDFFYFFLETLKGFLVFFRNPLYVLFFFVVFVLRNVEGFRELVLVKSGVGRKELGGRVLKRYEMHYDLINLRLSRGPYNYKLST